MWLLQLKISKVYEIYNFILFISYIIHIFKKILSIVNRVKLYFKMKLRRLVNI